VPTTSERRRAGAAAGLATEPALAALATQVGAAAAAGTPLRIVGANSRQAYGRVAPGIPLDVGTVCGIDAYAPTELVVTARAGTPLVELEAALAAHGQTLGFEPPRISQQSTLGGALACGWSGPRRPFSGAARDFVLGLEVLDGQGRLLRFGGEVMKNVAGFDVSRLMVGALGTLGVIVRASLRVVPRPTLERTLAWADSPDAAQARMLDLARAPWPVSGMAYVPGRLRVRVSGSAAAVEHACRRLEPDGVDDDADAFWQQLRDLSLPVLQSEECLWRLHVPPSTPFSPRDVIVDWGGALRWRLAPNGVDFFAEARAARGRALRLRGDANSASAWYGEPPAAERNLLERVKRVFDPAGVLNRGRGYAGL